MSRSDEDARVGRLLRAIRRSDQLTQRKLSEQANVPLLDLRRVERGQAGGIRLDRTRRLFAAAGGRARLSVWWNGAAADRLLDERHAAIVERLVDIVGRFGWLAAAEVTFAEYGERGSIDLLAAHSAQRAVAVFEVKSEIGSLEQMNRVLDVKARLAPKIAQAQFGWRPSVVARILVLPEDATLRRLMVRHQRTMAAIYPAGSREVRAWLRRPDGPLRGIWFLSDPRSLRPATG